jgi:hypothetical protein
MGELPVPALEPELPADAPLFPPVPITFPLGLVAPPEPDTVALGIPGAFVATHADNDAHTLSPNTDRIETVLISRPISTTPGMNEVTTHEPRVPRGLDPRLWRVLARYGEDEARRLRAWIDGM